MSSNQLTLSVHHLEEAKIRKIDQKKVQEYTESIKARGILQPIAVRPHPDKAGIFIMLDGHHRRVAAIAAGLQEIPCYVPDNVENFTELDNISVALQGNIKRKNMSPTQIGQTILMLFKIKPELTQAEVGEQLNISANDVSKFTRIAKLPPAVQKQVEDGDIMVGHAALATRLIKYLGQEDSDDWNTVAANAVKMQQTEFVAYVDQQVKSLRKGGSTTKEVDPTEMFRLRKKKEVVTMLNSLRGREDELDEKQTGFLRGLEWAAQVDKDSVAAYEEKQAAKEAAKAAKEAEAADAAFAAAAEVLN